jgi:hypothetical protein
VKWVALLAIMASFAEAIYVIAQGYLFAGAAVLLLCVAFIFLLLCYAVDEECRDHKNRRRR